MRPRPAFTVLLAVALLLALGVPASAHPRTVPAAVSDVPDSAVDRAWSTASDSAFAAVPAPPAASIESGVAGYPAGWLLLAMLAAGVAGPRIGGRRALALGLLAIVSVLGIEAAVHSVHHLDDLDGVDCAIATATGHMDGTVNVAPPTVTLAGAAVDRVPASASVVRDRRGARLEQQRAPPA